MGCFGIQIANDTNVNTENLLFSFVQPFEVVDTEIVSTTNEQKEGTK